MTQQVGSVVLALSMFVIDSPALSPPPEPHHHVILSENGRFCAAVSARRNRATIKQIRRGWIDKRLWTIPLYFEEAVVSNDGNYLFTWSGGDWIPKCTRQTNVIWAWLADGTTRQFTIGDFIEDLDHMEKNQVMGAWMASWGSPRTTYGEWIEVKTCEKRTLFANVKTGEVRSRRPW